MPDRQARGGCADHVGTSILPCDATQEQAPERVPWGLLDEAFLRALGVADA